MFVLSIYSYSLYFTHYKLHPTHLLNYSANGARNKAGDNKNSFVQARPKHLLTAINKWLQLEMYWQQRRRQFQLSTCNGDKTGPGQGRHHHRLSLPMSSLVVSLNCPLTPQSSLFTPLTWAWPGPGVGKHLGGTISKTGAGPGQHEVPGPGSA